MNIQPFDPKEEFSLAHDLLSALAQKQSLPPAVNGAGVEGVLEPVVAALKCRFWGTTHGLPACTKWLADHRQKLAPLAPENKDIQAVLEILTPLETKLVRGFRACCAQSPKPTTGIKPPKGALLLLFALSSYCGGSLIEKPFADWTLLELRVSR